MWETWMDEWEAFCQLQEGNGKNVCVIPFIGSPKIGETSVHQSQSLLCLFLAMLFSACVQKPRINSGSVNLL